MSYNLTFTNQAVDAVGKAPIVVAPGTTNTSTDLVLTGKGTPNYGAVLQDNLLHILENFASPSAPANPTVGQCWYDSSEYKLKVLVDKYPVTWKSIGGVWITNVGGSAPTQAMLGDLWFERSGPASGFLYLYSGLGRYPTTSTTIGGWEQVHPAPVVYAGREEYEEMRELVEQLAGNPLSTYGNGWIGKSAIALTDFGSLDADLRSKYKTLLDSGSVADAVQLQTNGTDDWITRQATSNTAYVLVDGAGFPSGSNDMLISGSGHSAGIGATIFKDNVSTTLPAGTVANQSFEDDGLIMWDYSDYIYANVNIATSTDFIGYTGSNTPRTAGGAYYFGVRYNVEKETWQLDNNAAWIDFTPAAGMYIIGTFSTFQNDYNSHLPGGKTGTIWKHAVPMVGSKIEHLRVEPNSQDWDALLACARWVVRRLEVPRGILASISQLPFVNDGRQPVSTLLALSASDVRHPTGLRRTREHAGIVTMVQSYVETMNALNLAIENRFSLRGINGSSGTFTSFDSTVTSTSNHLTYTGTLDTNAGVGTLAFNFNFATVGQFYNWFCSGQGFDIVMSHSGGSNASDNALRSLFAYVGTWRITADKTRFFNQGSPISMSMAPVKTGIWNSNGGTSSPSGITIATITVGTASVSVNLYRVAGNQLRVSVVINAGAVAAGTTQIAVNLIKDATTYSLPAVAAFSNPNAYSASDLVSTF